MHFLKDPSAQQIKLDLKGDHLRSIKQGRPWIYRDWLKSLPKAKSGARAMLRDRDGDLVAFGMYDPESVLAFRICAIGRERLDDELIEARLNSAVEIRKGVVSKNTTGYRLLNGEGDLLPGLVCDVYGESAVIKLDGDGPEGFWNVECLANWLRNKLSISAVYKRSKQREGVRGNFISGFEGEARVVFKENGLKFIADLENGQKTGFFLDQRDNRHLTRQYSANKSVLNLFSYTGGFSVACGAGGAKHVTSVDVAKGAIGDSLENWRINDLVKGNHEGIAADVFDYLVQAKAEKKKFDIVIVDPPSFAPGEKHVSNATDSYERLFAAALDVVDTNGMVCLSSCSSHITSAMFLEISQRAFSKAKKRGVVLANNGQPLDHPFPIACPELQYLKFVMFRVLQ